MLDRVKAALEASDPGVVGQTLGAACSGGADSTAALLALASLRECLGFSLAAVHLNHGLRGEESTEDEAFVRELAAELDIPLYVRRTDIRALASEAGLGLEACGRRARYDYFGELIASGACDRVATGHTLSDQAETVLLRLVRGAGLTGLAGILPEREPGILRPLLDVRSDEVRTFLRDKGIEWREDSSNADRAFRRNRVRLEVAPQLHDLNPRWDEALARTARQALSEQSYWEQTVREAAARICRPHARGVRIDASLLRVEHPALQRRLLRYAAGRIKESRQLSAAHVDSLLELCRKGLGTGRLELPGLTATRSLDGVLLSPSGSPRPAIGESIAISPPAEIATPDGRSRLRLDIRSQHFATGRYTEPIWSGLDWSKVSSPLILRPWQAGDFWRRDAAGRRMKLKELLQRARLEVWDRVNWPVLASGGEVVWTRGWGVSAGWRADADRTEVLTVRETDRGGREIRGIEQWLKSV